LATETVPGESSVDAIAVASPRPGSQRLGGGTFRSLKYRDFRLLWFSLLFTSAGQWFQQITVGWIVWDLTQNEFLLGSINGFRALPLLLFAPIGGVAADRFDRKWLLQSTSVLAFVSTATLTVIIFADLLEVWHLFVFTVITGVFWALNNPVRQSVVPNLVPKHDLMNALALQSAGFNFTRIIGPTLAGLILSQVGHGENFALQTLAYVGVFAMVIMVTIPPATRAATASIRENLGEGVRFVWSHATLRTQLFLALVPPVLAFPYMALMPVFATDVYGKEETAFGIMASAVGVGAVIGTLAIATLSNNIERRGILMMGAVLLLGVSLVAFSQTESFELALVFLALTGMSQMIFMTTNQTIVQSAAPDELRGRVMGIYMLGMGLMPLGGLIGGAMAHYTSAQTAVLVMGALVCVLAIGFMARAKNLRGV
jgi:MFS family permease